MNRRKSTVRATVLTVLTALLLAPLLAVGSTSAGAAEAAGPRSGWVRAAHLAPGTGQADVRLSPFRGGRTLTLDDISYGSVSGYQRVPAGLYTVALVPAGEGMAQAMVRQTVDVKAGSASTVFATGRDGDVTARVVTDDLTPPPAGKARIRLVSAAGDASRVNASVVGGPSLTKNAAFGSVSGYADVAAQTWTVKIAAGGASTAGGGQLDQKVTVAAGSVYTLLVLDGKKGLRLVPTRDSSGASTMPTGGVDTGGGYLARVHSALVGLRAAADVGGS